MHLFTKIYRIKGWTAKTLADHWGMSIRNLGRIAKDPSPRDWDAIGGLANLRNPKRPGSKPGE